jgi:hypothetical protein
LPGAGEVRRRARSGILREQGVLGECGTMTQACQETPGGAGGVANDDPALGVQRGGASSGPAEGPRRVREGGAHPERRAAAQGSRGATPGERQLERRPEGPECQLISEYVPHHYRPIRRSHGVANGDGHTPQAVRNESAWRLQPVQGAQATRAGELPFATRGANVNNAQKTGFAKSWLRHCSRPSG